MRSLPRLILHIRRLNSVRLPPPGSKTYRIDDIAAILDISRAAAYALVKKQNFRSIRVGHSIRVLRASFDAWLEEEGL